MREKVVARVVSVKGKCPVHREGDVITFRGPELVTSESDAVCYHALPAILHYVNALRVDPEGGKGVMVSCVDPGPPFTEGGNVVFEVKAEDE